MKKGRLKRFLKIILINAFKAYCLIQLIRPPANNTFISRELKG